MYQRFNRVPVPSSLPPCLLLLLVQRCRMIDMARQANVQGPARANLTEPLSIHPPHVRKALHLLYLTGPLFDHRGKKTKIVECKKPPRAVEQGCSTRVSGQRGLETRVQFAPLYDAIFTGRQRHVNFVSEPKAVDWART